MHPLYGLCSLWRGSIKSSPGVTKGFIPLQIAQKEGTKQAHPIGFPAPTVLSHWHLANDKILKPYFSFTAVLSYHVVLFFGKEMQLGRHMEVLVLLVAMGMSAVSSNARLGVPSFGLGSSAPPLLLTYLGS